MLEYNKLPSQWRVEFNILIKSCNSTSSWFPKILALQQDLIKHLPSDLDSFRTKIASLCDEMRTYGRGQSQTLKILQPFLEKIPTSAQNEAHIKEQQRLARKKRAEEQRLVEEQTLI